MCTVRHHPQSRCPPLCLCPGCPAASCCCCHTAACLRHNLPGHWPIVDMILKSYERMRHEARKMVSSGCGAWAGCRDISRVRARPAGGGQPCHSQQMDIQVSHRPLFESYQICHRKPSHSSSRVTPARVIFRLIPVSLICQTIPKNTITGFVFIIIELP